ncbi:hypothetical protein GBA52_010335, partial [Prunus armeniaca]
RREIVRDDIAHVVVVISSSDSKSNLFISTHSSDLDLQRRMEGCMNHGAAFVRNSMECTCHGEEGELSTTLNR